MRNTLIKRMLATLGLIVCLLAAWFSPRLAYRYWRDKAAARVVTVDSPRFSFGIVEPGQMVSHRYRVTNGTKRTVRILKVLSSCACTVADLPKRELAPGESVDIAVNLDTSGRYGSLVKDVAVVTDVEDNAVLRLSLAGEVRMLYSPPSKTLSLTYQPNQQTSEEFWITTAGKARNSSLRLRPDSIPDFLQVNLTRAPSNAFQVQVGVKPGKTPEKFSAKILLDSSDSTLPPYAIFVEGAIQSRFTMAPRKLYLGIVTPGEQVHRRLTIWANAGGPSGLPAKLSLVSTSSASCQVTAEVAKSAPNRWDVDFELKVRSDLRPGDAFSGLVVLEDDRQSRIEIPIEGFVSDAIQM